MMETEKKGTHHHFHTKKEMIDEMHKNWNPFDTFSYGRLLPKPTGIFRLFFKSYEDQIEGIILDKLINEVEKS